MDNPAPKRKSKFPSAGFIVILLVIFYCPLFFANFLTWWPPIPVERHAQREKLAERVQVAGGWDAVRQDCISLAEQHTNGFYSHWHETNDLPRAIVALKPLMVEYAPQYGCISMRIFGIHSTGGHSTPYFGLEIDTSTNSTGYKHGTGYDNGGVIGNYHSIANQVADGIYEIY
jgi:hypothetical protein